jgi:hypothetical protein
MTGRSIMPLLRRGEASPGEIASRDHVLAGKERHVPAQEGPDMGGTPMRSIRTDEFLYIRNFRPDRWPAGTPHWQRATLEGAWLGDCDNGPTKTLMAETRDTDAEHARLYEFSFGKRPADELYDLRKDPDQLQNVASDPEYAEIRNELEARLMGELRETGDPRVVGGAERLEAYPYYGGSPRWPGLEKDE